VDEDALSDFKAFGVTVEIEQSEKSDDIEILECNWPSLEAFLACSTQWRVVTSTSGGMNGLTSRMVFIGLDYTACKMVLRHLKAAAHIFDDLRAMEEEALPHLNEVDQ